MAMKDLPILTNHVTRLPSRMGVLRRSFAHQSSLPRLPVPALSATLEKYLRFVQPLVSAEDFSHTKEIVEKFSRTRGPVLQERLVARSKASENWLAEWWLQVAYLDFRAPVTVNVSPGIRFSVNNFETESDWLGFAARFLAGVLDFKQLVDKQQLPVDRMGKDPLCMMQYYNVLGTCRIPGLRRDEIKHHGGPPPLGPRHICVLHNNRIFSMDVQTEAGDLIHEGAILEQLKQIVAKSQSKGPPVGLLTSEDRTSWAKAYLRMRAQPENVRSFDVIQRSIFALCLDQPILQGVEPERRDSVVALNMLHGQGADVNSSNRWFDKTCQFIVCRDGACGLTYEHSPAEGPPVIALVDHAFDHMARRPQGDIQKASGEVTPPQELTFKIDSETEQDFEVARSNMWSLVSDLQLTAFTLSSFGKAYAKMHKLSPDAFIQMAFQLTYFRLYGVPCATYESGSTRRFALGRTDTIRSCGPVSVAFTRAMDDKSLNDKERAGALRAAVQEHSRHTMEVLTGSGIDRHLLGLKLIAIESGEDVPDIFMDNSFNKATHFNLSTSQVPAKVDASLCFGPVVPDGYGLCYNPQKTRVHITVTAYKSCPETDSDRFAGELKRAFHDMQHLLDTTVERPKL